MLEPVFTPLNLIVVGVSLFLAGIPVGLFLGVRMQKEAEIKRLRETHGPDSDW